MNTSCEPASCPETEGVWDFQYPMIAPLEFGSQRESVQAEREMRLQRAHEAALRAARQEGMSEGERQAEGAMAESLAAERQAISRAVEQFAEERRRYFHRVEADVVTLALAIARKLLRREAQIDPLLLSGVVRVALERMQAGSEVFLRTSPAQLEAWKIFFTAEPESRCRVELVPDEALEPGQVVLETLAGKAEVNLEGQLREIESGFLDLLRADEGTPHAQPAV